MPKYIREKDLDKVEAVNRVLEELLMIDSELSPSRFSKYKDFAAAVRKRAGCNMDDPDKYLGVSLGLIWEYGRS